LKQAEEKSGRSVSVNVHVENITKFPLVAKFIHAYTTQDSGKTIEIRPMRQLAGKVIGQARGKGRPESLEGKGVPAETTVRNLRYKPYGK
jgi:hypothetical protein